MKSSIFVQSWPAIMKRFYSSKEILPEVALAELRNFNSEFQGLIEKNLKNSLEVRVSRSSGPGGQHVNTTNSKVELRFNLSKASAWIPSIVIDRMKAKFKNKITSDNDLQFYCETQRSQAQNLRECEDKVIQTIRDLAAVPTETSPEKKEKVKNLIQKANETRLKAKKIASEKKRSRKEGFW